MLTPAHTFIEGKVGRFPQLWPFPALNFVISQICIFVSLARMIRKKQISGIRAGDALYLGLFGWALSRLCGIPLIVRVGGNSDKVYETTGHPMQRRLFFSRKIEKIVERFVFARADLVAGANQDNLGFALSNGARPEFSTLFRYGNLIDRLHFVEPKERSDGGSLLNEFGMKPRSFILYIGRLEHVKHPDDVLRVLATMRMRGHDVKALLAGDGQLLAQLVELANELGVKDQVMFAGNRDQLWLSRVIPLAAAVLSPHTGRALSEAALGGAPVVAYDVDWQGELIRSGLTGALVPNLAWGKMADEVERFLAEPDYAHDMGKALRRRALEMLDPTSLNKHEQDQYAALLQRVERLGNQN